MIQKKTGTFIRDTQRKSKRQRRKHIKEALLLTLLSCMCSQIVKGIIMRNMYDKNSPNEYTISSPVEGTGTARTKAPSGKSEKQFTLFSKMAGR